MNASDMDEVLKEFLVESHENLDRMDLDLVALERDPSSADRLANVFRTIHTIKGTCGFLGLGKLQALAHAGEDLLSALRDGTLSLDPPIANALLALGDAIRGMLAHIEARGDEGDLDCSALVATLRRLQGRAAAAAGEASPGGAGDGVGHALAELTVRIDVGVLDRLVNLVGELVLARNEVLRAAAATDDATLAATSQRLNAITTRLQEGVLKTRMQPIGNAFDRFPRVVRDLAAACGKRARVEIVGRETELDRTIIEAIKDPLTHVVRNALDHGIETPEERIAAGKPPEGRVLLRAFHEGGQVNVEIGDDGRGIDPERVRAKALERGLVAPDRAARMSERELVHLVFAPGFSTAETVTSVSGRGVGMDVVKTNIEKIGGIIDVESRVGEGTTVRVTIPLTLAIIPALVVASGGERYAIPQANLLEVVRLQGEQARAGIEWIHAAPVHRLRGRLLPLVDLRRELGLDGGDALRGAVVNVVVLEAGDRHFGLVVDAVLDTGEVVVKPLGKLLASLRVFAGATIMGDGRVALILDVLALAQRAHVIAEAHSPQPGERVAPAAGGVERRRLLLLAARDGGRVAVPLAAVARLEEIPREAVERVGGRDVARYRGRILPLVSVGEAASEPDGPLRVVVWSDRGRTVGLVVGGILDVVEESLAVDASRARPGVLGSAIVRHRVTEILDVPAIVGAAEAA